MKSSEKNVSFSFGSVKKQEQDLSYGGFMFCE